MKPPRTCQLLDMLWLEDGDFRAFIVSNGGIRWARGMAIEAHHLFGGTSRINRVANLIDLSLPVHQWIHHRPAEGRVACLYRQKQLGKLEWSVLDECFGGRPGRVRGLIESKPLTGVYETWRMELLS